MFALVQKGGEIRPVHSQRDLEYMLWAGWQAVKPKVEIETVVLKPEPEPVRIKRKYTRRGNQ